MIQDKRGKKIDTIWHTSLDGWEVPQGPTITFKEDKTYLKRFTSQHTDSGEWYYDAKKKRVVYHLYFDTTTLVGEYMMTKGGAKQDAKGDYYDLVSSPIEILTSESLVLIEEKKRRRIFKKRNN